MARPFPVAASSAVELALVGPHRPAEVIAATPHALYLQLTDVDTTVICLASAEAVRVPCAVVLESKALPPAVAPGTIASVGGATIQIGSAAFRVGRWWRPPRPRGLGAVPPARLAGAVRWLTGRVADPLDAPGRAAVADLVRTVGEGGRPDSAVASLLGRGPGLTPTGDDVLAGAMVTLAALGAPAGATLSTAVLRSAPDATTTVSLALLRHAARGECIPQLGDLVEALATGGSDTGGALPRAAGALLAVGHCSGAGLLHGVMVGVALAHSRLARRVAPAAGSASSPAAA
jgi:hypothetical protein